MGPTVTYVYFNTWAHVGSNVIFDVFAGGLLRIYRQSVATLCVSEDQSSRDSASWRFRGNLGFGGARQAPSALFRSTRWVPFRRAMARRSTSWMYTSLHIPQHSLLSSNLENTGHCPKHSTSPHCFLWYNLIPCLGLGTRSPRSSKLPRSRRQIGRASCRERVSPYV